jgi:hypothetical protein
MKVVLLSIYINKKRKFASQLQHIQIKYSSGIRIDPASYRWSSSVQTLYTKSYGIRRFPFVEQ